MSSMQPPDAGPAPVDFDEMFRETYWPMVRSLAVACGDAQEAEDAVQDAFERAFVRWRRIGRYDDPRSWIRHVALNRLRDHFRREGRRRTAVDRLAADAALIAPAPEPPGDVAALLAALPPQQRIAAALFYVDDLGVAEIARSMALSEGAVKYHLHAARRALAGRVPAP
jgi:RNA polymerase sigma-70 factor, ECF subfamily